ncbi:MAG TPA: DNA polymerase III subunit beta, partial [Anaerolineales bacterium]|nr:DNA polymerase III subunit beta [Anaerolineales bacterium]
MKAQVLQSNLHKGLGIVQRAVASRATLPILSNILLGTDGDGRMMLAATNLELAIRTWIGGKVEAPGTITAPAKTLADLISNLPGDGEQAVNLSTNDRTVTLSLTGRGFKSNIKCIESAEFPLMPPANDGQGIILPDPRRMIGDVIFASASDEARPTLTGALLTLAGDTATLGAADGFRLAVHTAKLAAPVEKPQGYLIPSRALAELAKVLDAKEPLVFCPVAGRDQVLFHNGAVEVISALIEGQYPQFENVIPKSHNLRATINTEELNLACKSALVFARESGDTIRLKFVRGDGDACTLTISAQAPETGDNAIELDITAEGEGIELALNANYLRDAL